MSRNVAIGHNLIAELKDKIPHCDNFGYKQYFWSAKRHLVVDTLLDQKQDKLGFDSKTPRPPWEDMDLLPIIIYNTALDVSLTVLFETQYTQLLFNNITAVILWALWTSTFKILASCLEYWHSRLSNLVFGYPTL